jgi:hypothetical protein
MLPDYEREKLNAEILLNKAAYGACLRRNHGFLFAGPEGWRLSPVYDVNPVPVEVKKRILTTAKQNRQSARRKRSMKLSSNSRCPALSKAQITYG